MAVTDDQVLGRRIVVVATLLILANIAAWVWAFQVFAGYPLLIGTATLAYAFGLRHAVDADHIAAIDNVTRKLVQQGQRPVGVGLFFALGHSTIVVALTVGIAGAADGLQARMAGFKAFGAVTGAVISAVFLFIIAFANLGVLISTLRVVRRVRNGGQLLEGEMDLLPSGGGVLTRLFRRCFRVIGQPWQMYPLGFLFGLGFDTATEVGLLGISATQATQGLSIWSVLVFPALFTAGMTLIDTADGILMLGAYGWAMVKPMRKLYYNVTITAVSVVVAFLIGGLEALNLIGDQLGLSDGGGFFGAVGMINDHFGLLGYLVVSILALCWIVSWGGRKALGSAQIRRRA
jgi:high-affinity nickel-transport protein